MSGYLGFGSGDLGYQGKEDLREKESIFDIGIGLCWWRGVGIDVEMRGKLVFIVFVEEEVGYLYREGWGQERDGIKDEEVVFLFLVGGCKVLWGEEVGGWVEIS